MDKWLVESGSIKKGDIIKRVVKEEIIVDEKLENDLKPYGVKVLREMGYKIYRYTEVTKTARELAMQIVAKNKENLSEQLFGLKMGTWTVHSVIDPRWNNEGRAKGLVSQGGPKEMRDWVEQCKKEFGEPPDDAYCAFVKD